jgi:uncharacterized protein YciI
MDNVQMGAKRFIYFYFNRNEPEKVRQTVPAHIGYWKRADLKGYMGGPFGDRTGGMISFIASGIQEATEIIQQDPFILEDLVDQNWIKEWILE